MFIVTGANGFIGSALVHELNSRGIQDIICVDVVDLKERSEPLRKARYSQFLTTPKFFDWCSKNYSSKAVKAIFHLGAISSTTETDWDKLVKNNIKLSQILFEHSKKWGATFIYASSGAVYGDGHLGFSDEADTEKFEPLNLYGRSKKDFDVWALKQSETPPRWAGLRFFNVYGPNEYHKGDMASVAYKAFLQIKATSQLKLFRSHNPNFNDGEQLRDFVYVKDITRWMWEIYENSTFPSGIFNLGYGKARTWLSLAENVFRSLKQPPQIEWVDIPLSIRDQYQYYTQAGMNKCFSAGLSQPKFTLESGIQDYFANYLTTDDPYL